MTKTMRDPGQPRPAVARADPPRSARRIRAPVAALVSALAVTLGAAAPAGAAPASATGNGVGAPIRWGPCVPGPPSVQCARIRVPLDWDRPAGRAISLAVIRHRASKPGERIGTLFINPGGPGDTGVGLVRGDPEGIDAFGGGRFDVVSWDPRGTNGSTRVRCFTSPKSEAAFWAGAAIPTTQAVGAPFALRAAGLARRCGRVSGWLLPHISTADTARDLDHLRVLSGERTMTFVGLSYGSYIGETYANLFPSRVRAMMLMGLVDPVRYSTSAETRIEMWASAADRVFAREMALCDRAGPQRCALAGGGLTAAARVDRLFGRLRRGPIPAPGATPPLSSPESLSYADLLLSQFQPLRSPRTWPQNAADLRAAFAGNGSALESGASPFVAPSGWAGATTSAAIQCADGPARQRLSTWPQFLGRLQRISRLQGPVHVWWEWAPCAAWPVRGQDSYRGPWNRRTPNPILLVNQRDDPNSNYQNAVRAQRLLGNAVLLTHEGYGHLSFQDPSDCVDRAVTRYLTELAVPPNGTSCPSNRQPFDPNFGS